MKQTVRDQVRQPVAPVPAGTLAVVRCWSVCQGLEYHNRCPRHGYASNGPIIIRTLAGEGEVDVDKRLLRLGPDSVAVLTPARLRSYRCSRSLWRFWWFECDHGSLPPLPPDTVQEAAATADEAERLDHWAALLEQGAAAAGLASAELLAQCHRWRAAAMAGRSGARDDRSHLQAVLARMQATATCPLPISELARLVHLCPHRFRIRFRQAMGCTPKAYYENLRLTQATAWLRDNQMKLADIAARLGYSSAFHFSRAFSHRYGQPPSHFRNLP